MRSACLFFLCVDVLLLDTLCKLSGICSEESYIATVEELGEQLQSIMSADGFTNNATSLPKSLLI